jgi:putative endonuclease
MWNVYIIEGVDEKLYTGITNNLNRRLAEHNLGYGGKFTRFRGPFKLRYAEDLSNRSEALKREAGIKKLSREEKLKLIKSLKATGMTI